MSGDESTQGVFEDPKGSNHQNLRSTLSKLSNSRSRPSPSPAAEEEEAAGPSGLGSRTMRFVSGSTRNVLSKSGLSSIFPSTSSPSATVDQAGIPRTHNSDSPAPPSFVSRGTMAPDTSTILYPTLTSHPPPISHPMLFLCLPQSVSSNGENRVLDNDQLFDVVLGRLEPWVGEEGEGGYVLIVLAGGDMAGPKVPGVGWWAWKWRRIPRKYRKNLKRLYIVHPSLFTRTLLPVLLPFLSPKSYAKLHPLPSFLSLHHTHGVSLHGIDLTLPILHEEARVLHERPDLIPTPPSRVPQYATPPPTAPPGWSFGGAFGAVKGVVGSAVGYLPLVPTFGSSYPSSADAGRIGRGHWGRTAAAVVEQAGGRVPRIFVVLRKTILGYSVVEQGIFRRSSSSAILPLLTALLDIPPTEAPSIPWDEIAIEDPLLPPKILLRLLAEMEEPLIPPEKYNLIRKIHTSTEIITTLLTSLDPSAGLILAYVIHILHHVSLFETQTKMSPLALAIVLAPSLIRGPDPLVDAAMCLEPGKSLPPALNPGGTGASGNTLVGVLKFWIEEYTQVYPESGTTGDARQCRCPWVEGKEHPTPSLPPSAKMSPASPIAKVVVSGRHELLTSNPKSQRGESESERSWTMVDP